MNDALHLPRFSSAKDVDEFVDVLERFERGEISPEKFRAFRLTRGVYGQRQTDSQMLRIKIPQGVIAPEQLEALATLSEKYSRGFGHLTTRQNFQFHFMKMNEMEEALRLADTVGLTTREACGNTVRNVTCDPLSGVSTQSLFDVRPYGEAITRHFLRASYAGALPRKFKIALSSTDQDEAMGAINDLGLIAQVRDGIRGFKIVAAGGLSTTPQNALVLHEFVATHEILDVCEAVVRLFDRTGNRENKHRARLKYVLRKHGEAAFRAMYNEELGHVRANGGTPLHSLPTLWEPPPPSRADDESTQDPAILALRNTPEYLAFRSTNVQAQAQEGYVTVTARLLLGDVTATQMRGIARAAINFADGSIRATIDQNLVFRYVPKGRVVELYAALRELGLARSGANTVSDVTSCPGAETCALAVTASRQLGTSISDRLDALQGEAAQARDLAASATIKISGCPNSCGQHHVADLGFHGAVKKVGERSAPVYQLHLGGGIDGATGATFGRQIIKIPARRVAEAVERLLVLYTTDRNAEETPRAFYRRVSAQRIHEVLDSLAVLSADGPNADFVDLGQSDGFEVAIGTGECAA